MNKVKLFIVTISVLILSACAAGGAKLNEEQCANIDWHALGISEGETGRALRNLAKEVKTCAKYSIDINPQTYASGWNIGIKTYCTPLNAYDLGRINKPFPNVCPDSLIHEFRDAYNRGLDNFIKVKAIKAKLKYVNRNIDKDNRQIRKLERFFVKHDANKLQSEIKHQQQLMKKLEQTGEYYKATKIKFIIDKLQLKLYLANAKESRSRTMLSAYKKNVTRLIQLKKPLDSELAQLK